MGELYKKSLNLVLDKTAFIYKLLRLFLNFKKLDVILNNEMSFKMK